MIRAYPSTVGLTLLLVLATAANSRALADPKSAPEQHEDKKHGFRLEVPPELSKTSSSVKIKNTLLRLQNRSSRAGGGFRETVEVRLLSAKPMRDVGLDDAVKALRKVMEKQGVKVLEVTDAKVGGLEAKRIEYAQRVATAQMSADVKAVRYVVLRNDWLYGVDLRATEKTFDEFVPLGQKVVDSFTWIDPADDKTQQQRGDGDSAGK